MNKAKVLLIGLVGLFAFPFQGSAQTCGELFKRANLLKASGRYADAITYYQRAMDCDGNLKKDCNRLIKECRQGLVSTEKNKLDISAQEIRIPYQGGDSKITVTSSKKWNVEGTNDWCGTENFNSKAFVVQCREQNNSTRDKETTLTVKSGSLYKTLKVIQEARPEYIEVDATSLSFPSKGTEQKISVESNAKWDVTSIPSWCKVEKGNDGIRIIVSPNDKIMERNDNIVIVSPSKSVTIKIYQGAGEEHLTLSQNNLYLSSEGDVSYMKVYTDADNWFLGDFPSWINVQKVGKDSIRVACGKNIPNGEERTGSVQVKTDRQTVGVQITQGARMHQDLIFPESKIVGGHNFSIGFCASYLMPSVSTSAGGDYVGSVVDYSLGTSAENASYKSASGFSFGAFADMRLYRNIFLTAGVNFTQIKYKNEFNQKTTLTTSLNTTSYKRGEVQNGYTESYTHTMMEIPILASYRFKINDMSHVQLNLGPVLNFGLSAKMKLDGNTDGDGLKAYDNITNNLISNSNESVHEAISSEFDLYKSEVSWTRTYTIGDDAPVNQQQKFAGSPLKKFNYGLRLGAAYEISGLSFGLSYTMMLSNMANKNYWENDRWTVLNNSDTTMKGYKHRINYLEFKLAYTLRYVKFKK